MFAHRHIQYERDVCESYRTYGDGDVKVLGSVVLLEGVDIKPNLKNKQFKDKEACICEPVLFFKKLVMCS